MGALLVGCATSPSTNPEPGAKVSSTAPSGAQNADDTPPASTGPFQPGTPAPDFEVATLDGKSVKLSSFKGHPVLIDFWATWCPPCREGLPITNKMHEQFKSQGLQVLAISNEDAKTVKDFIDKNKYSMPTFIDPDGDSDKAYQIQGIPTTVVIDAEGKVSSYTMGLEPEESVLAALRKVGIKTG